MLAVTCEINTRLFDAIEVENPPLSLQYLYCEICNCYTIAYIYRSKTDRAVQDKQAPWNDPYAAYVT